MPDVKISALPATTTPADADVLAMVSGGASTKVSLNQLTAYIESRGRQNNASVADQTLAAADTYLAGSSILIPNGRIKVGSMYRCRFDVTKTAAGTAAPAVAVRMGSAGTIADPLQISMSLATQTAVIDEGMIEVFGVFQLIGAAGRLRTFARLTHRLTTTGLANSVSPSAVGTSTVETNVNGTYLGLSVNAGASSAWTVRLVQAELFNLA